MPDRNVEFVEGLYGAGPATADKKSVLAGLPAFITQTWVSPPNVSRRRAFPRRTDFGAVSAGRTRVRRPDPL